MRLVMAGRQDMGRVGGKEVRVSNCGRGRERW